MSNCFITLQGHHSYQLSVHLYIVYSGACITLNDRETLLTWPRYCDANTR